MKGQDLKDYEGKVAVITGAGSGMGRAMVREFAGRGAKVAALGRTMAKLEAVAAEAGAEVLPLALDVADSAGVEAAMAAILLRWGRIDVLVNNAGVLDSYAPAHEVPLEEWHQVIATNLTGPFLMCRAVLPGMVAQGKGVIVNIASISSHSAAGGGSAYTASKHGVLGLTRQLCFEYGPLGVRVNAICPGATATPMAIPEEKGQHSPDMEAAVAKVPARRWCQPEEIAGLAACLASDAASYLHGSDIVIDGGWLAGAREAF